jgi:cytolysin-activating lysine-acyltransferase
MTGNPTTTEGAAMPAGPGNATGLPLDTIVADAALGAAVRLLMASPSFRYTFLADLDWMVQPPILLNQHRLFRAEGRVVAFASWAYLSVEAEARLQEPNPRLAPADWKSGDRLWLVSMVAPFGHAEMAVKELAETALKGQRFKMHRLEAGGRAVVEVNGAGLSRDEAGK